MRLFLRSVAGAAAILCLISATAALAAEPSQPARIQKGVDLWMTVTGYARTSFAADPIPAGFFCLGSSPFTEVESMHRSAGEYP